MVSTLLGSWPLRPWLVTEDSSFSRRGMAVLVRRRARELGRQGLRPGDRVGWWPRPTQEALETLLALWEAKAEVVLLPLRATRVEMDMEARRLALCATSGAQGILPDLPDLEQSSSLRRTGASPQGFPGRVLVRSSGSLGGARWIQHRLESLLLHAHVLCAHLEVGPRDLWQLALPLDHVGGLAVLMRGLRTGCALALPTMGLALHPHATWTSLVPTQLGRLLEEGHKPRALRGVLLGGAALPASLARRALAQSWPLWMGYGSTETGSAISVQRVRETPPAAGHSLAPHRLLLEEGRICVASPCLCEAILDEHGRSIPLRGGLWRSGDAGLWRKGSLHLLGRLDRVIVSGGEKIPPECVEAALLELPGLRQAVVVPVADATWGQRPVAFVEWKAGHELGLEEVRGRLGVLPRHWHPVALLPWPLEERALKVSHARLKELATAWREHQGKGEARTAAPGKEWV